MSEIKKTMMLVTSVWGPGQMSFSLLPLTQDAPFSSAFYNPENKALIVMSAFKKETVVMSYLLDDNGDKIAIKNPKKGENEFKKKQIVLDTFTETYVLEPLEIDLLIKTLAINASSFNYLQYMMREDLGQQEPEIYVPEKPKIEIISK